MNLTRFLLSATVFILLLSEFSVSGFLHFIPSVEYKTSVVLHLPVLVHGPVHPLSSQKTGFRFF